jgi:hypothetical protein
MRETPAQPSPMLESTTPPSEGKLATESTEPKQQRTMELLIDQLLSVHAGDYSEYVAVDVPQGISDNSLLILRLKLTREAATSLGQALYTVLTNWGLDPAVDNTKPRVKQ